MNKPPYGMELLIDLKDCNPLLFTREDITRYLTELGELLNLQLEDLHFWDDLDTPEEDKQTAPHAKGTTAVQFLLTSNIVVHTLDDLREVYVNIFSCSKFDPGIASRFTSKFFQGKPMYSSPTVVIRGQRPTFPLKGRNVKERK